MTNHIDSLAAAVITGAVLFLLIRGLKLFVFKEVLYRGTSYHLSSKKTYTGTLTPAACPGNEPCRFCERPGSGTALTVSKIRWSGISWTKSSGSQWKGKGDMTALQLLFGILVLAIAVTQALMTDCLKQRIDSLEARIEELERFLML